MKVIAFTKYDRSGASSRVRCYNYLRFMSDKYEISFSPLFNEEYVSYLYSHGKKQLVASLIFYIKRFVNLVRVFFSKEIDIVWIEKELFPYIPIPFELLLNLSGKKVVYDYDDAVFHNYDRLPFNNLFTKKFSLIAKYSDHIMVGNQYLRDYFSYVPEGRITIIPTVIDLNVYKVSRESKLKLDNEISIVWIGTPNTQKYLSLVDDAIRQLQNKYNINLKLIGVNKETLSIKCNFQPIKWDATTEATIIGACDIGIMPVYNSNFERGKCGFKLIQYMAQGLPTIASPVGANVDISIGSGLLAETSDDWKVQLETLITNSALRAKLGANGIVKVKEYYNYNVQAKVISNIFDSLVSKGY